mgnify:CR=1 FL=1
MIIGSLSENKEIEKRISITPEMAKKYISLSLLLLSITSSAFADPDVPYGYDKESEVIVPG